MPQDLFYHNWEHTCEVVAATKEIAAGEGLSAEETEMLILAAWFHDTGYIKKYVGHEEESVDIAIEALSKWNYSEEKIHVIDHCIIATKFRHEPDNKMEAVLIDADRLSMGKPEFAERGELLRKEWGTYLQKEYSDVEWAEVQEKYLLETCFYTRYCQEQYGEKREANLKKMKEKRLRLEQEVNPITRESVRWIERVRAMGSMFLLYQLLGQIIALTLSLTLWGGYDYSIGIGFISGIFIGTLLWYSDQHYEKFIIRKVNFPMSLLVGTFLLVALFKFSQFISLFFYEWFIEKISLKTIIQSDIFKTFVHWDHILYQLWIAFIMSLILNFVKLTSRIIGPRVMVNYLQGKYHQPIEEERIFMFIDLNSSTSLAEKMDIIQYHKLLDQFFYDIAGPVSKYKGEIYQYVGDEVVITWKMRDGLKNSNCVRCYFRILKQLNKNKETYIRLFGFMPDFKAGLHGGKVVAGEVGKNKIEIVFHGDVINTSERIMNQCKPLGKKVLISENLLRRLDLLPYLHCEYVTSMLFKGKENEVSLYTLTRDDKQIILPEI